MKRARPQALDRSSTGLKAGHHFGTEQITRARPHTAPDQMASVALEMALEEPRKRLSAKSQTSWILVQPLSLEGARASIRHHTPHDEQPKAGLPRSNPSSSSAAPLRPRPRPRTARRMGRRLAQTPRPIKPRGRSRPKKTTWRVPRSRHIRRLPAARRRRPKTSSTRFGRSSTSSTKGGRPTRTSGRHSCRFGGFGPVALSLFPDPVTGSYKDPAWQALGETLRMLLSPEEYESAKRTTFNAFYTSPTVIRAMHEALARLGVPREATVLEPGCGTGNFMALAPQGMRFIGVELDSLSGRIARTLHPAHDIRIENFRDTKLPKGCIDAVIGNVPFADVKLEHRGLRLSLHDFFFAKSIDALKPGGVLALVTSHFTLDKFM